MVTKVKVKIRHLCIFLPKFRAFKRVFDETKYMSFLIKGDELLKKYSKIWNKIRNGIKYGFVSESMYNIKHLKTKLNILREKSKQIFTMIKYQKKFLSVFVYQ